MSFKQIHQKEASNFKVCPTLVSHSFRNLEGKRMKVEHGKPNGKLAKDLASERVSGSEFSGVKTRFPDVR